MIRVSTISQTCIACPAQWEGRTDDNRPIYVRYRGGWLSVSIGPIGGDIWSAVGGTEVYSRQRGDPYDGFMTYDELRSETVLDLTWPEQETE